MASWSLIFDLNVQSVLVLTFLVNPSLQGIFQSDYSTLVVLISTHKGPSSTLGLCLLVPSLYIPFDAQCRLFLQELHSKTQISHPFDESSTYSKQLKKWLAIWSTIKQQEQKLHHIRCPLSDYSLLPLVLLLCFSISPFAFFFTLYTHFTLIAL